MTRFYLDTEFAEDGKTIDLISIALVCEDGRELYAINSEFNPDRCNDWVKAHVLPKLPPCNCGPFPSTRGAFAWTRGGHAEMCLRRPRSFIAKQVREFVGGDNVEIWTYFGAYDWVLFCQLFGTMIELPRGFPMFTMDLKQYGVQLGITESLETLLKPEGEHDALEDARWNQRIHWRLIHMDGHRGLQGACPVCEFTWSNVPTVRVKLDGPCPPGFLCVHEVKCPGAR